MATPDWLGKTADWVEDVYTPVRKFVAFAGPKSGAAISRGASALGASPGWAQDIGEAGVAVGTTAVEFVGLGKVTKPFKVLGAAATVGKAGKAGTTVAKASASAATHVTPAAKSLSERAARKANIIAVTQKPGTSKRAFDKKVGALQAGAKRGELKVVKNPDRDPQLTKAHRKALGKNIKAQYGKRNPEFAAHLQKKMDKAIDIDHTIDLQLGGPDRVGNLGILERPINRSLGPQIQNQIKHLPEGAKIDRVIVKPRG